MPDYLDYLARLSRQHPEVIRIRDEAEARGDSVTVFNCDALLIKWAASARQRYGSFAVGIIAEK